MKNVFVSICITTILFSCSLQPFDSDNVNVNLNDIKELVDFNHIKALAYMGGSIYYDPQYPNNCPVVYHARIAFRLSRVAESTI